ncbi:MAG: hypothetical protein SGARI_005417 [Bacillariaceae sp.]
MEASNNMLKRTVAFVNTSALESDYSYLDDGPRKRFRRDPTILVANESWQATEPQKTSKPNTSRVQFCPFVQCQAIPCLEQQDKLALYYSEKDYVKFAAREKRRRKSFVLTMRVIHQQKKRIASGQDPIPSCKLVALYHYVLSTKKPQSSSFSLSSAQSPNAVGGQRHATPRAVNARAA